MHFAGLTITANETGADKIYTSGLICLLISVSQATTLTVNQAGFAKGIRHQPGNNYQPGRRRDLCHGSENSFAGLNPLKEATMPDH